MKILFRDFMNTIRIGDSTYTYRDCDAQFFDSMVMEEGLTLEEVLERYELSQKEIEAIKRIQNGAE